MSTQNKLDNFALLVFQTLSGFKPQELKALGLDALLMEADKLTHPRPPETTSAQQRSQLAVADSILDRIRTRVLENAARWPDEWNGVEISVLVEKASYYVAHVHPTSSSLKKRVGNAKNEILFRNLI